MSPVKIVHLSTYLDGGAATAAYRIHEALLKNGVDSLFLTTQDIRSKDLRNVFVQDVTPKAHTVKESFWEREKNRIRFRIKKHLGINLVVPKESITKLFNETKSQLDCEIATLPFAEYDILENPLVKNADIIHLHWVAGMIDYSSFFRNNKKPVVWTLHDMNPFKGLFHYGEDEQRNSVPAKKIDKEIRLIKQKAIKHRKSPLMFVTPTNWLYKEATDSLVFRKMKGCCIPYAIDISQFSSVKVEDFKRQHNIPEENNVFLFVAHSVDVKRKGFDILIEALKKISHLPATLLVLGAASEINVPGLDIRYLGSIHDNAVIANYYTNSDAFIIPSREDNLPNTMLESLACGTPVIGFAVGGIMEQIVDFETGLLAGDISATALAKAIETFCEKKEVFNREHIIHYAKEHFNENTVAAKYMQVYHQLLQKD